MRYISGMERLWGGLLLFGEMGAFDCPAEGSTIEEVACWPAYRVEGLSSQKGMAILRPGYLAFLPSAGRENLVDKLAGGFANELSGQVLGVKWISAQAKPPVDLLLQLLHGRDPGQFDAYVNKLVDRFGGQAWEPGEAEVVKEAFPLQPNRHVLLFKQGGVAVRGVPAGEQLSFVDGVLSQWAEGKPIRVVQPVWRLAAVSAVVTIPALLLAWGGYAMSGSKDPDSNPGLAYGFAAAVGTVATLLWLVTLWVAVRASRGPKSPPSANH
jgi:hypothetical protein